MKAMKKMTAIILAVCMLVGMPLSIDVAAVEGSEDYFTITGVEIVDDTKLKVTFSEPVNTPWESKLAAWIRVYDGTGRLRYAVGDGTTAKLNSADSGAPLQWKVTGWTKDGDGTTWTGTIRTTGGLEKLVAHTYTGIMGYLQTVIDANGRTLTPANGYKVQLSFLDSGTGKVVGNNRIDNFKSDSNKKLYAANKQNPGEERAVYDLPAPLEITDVSIYDDKYVIFTFSEDIVLTDAELKDISSDDTTTYNYGKFYLGAHANHYDGGIPVQHNSSYIQTRLRNAQKVGTAGNKIMMTMTDSWSNIKNLVDAYESANSKELSVVVRFESGSNTTYYPHFKTADGKQLIRSNASTRQEIASAKTANDGRHVVMVNPNVDVTIEKVTGDTAKNALIVEFSEPIKYTATGNQVYVQRFTNVNGVLNLDNKGTSNATVTVDGQDPLWQVKPTGFSASDANGNTVEKEYSKYWVFTFEETYVDTAVGYYADGNDAYSPTVGYGFGVYESSAGDLSNYIEGFASETDAYGNTRYLRVNSTGSGRRYFKELTVDDKIVTVEDAYLIDDKMVEVTFSEPVMIDQDGVTSDYDNNANKYGYTSIRVTQNNNVVTEGSNYLQVKVSKKVPVNPDENGYAKVWHFMPDGGQSLSAWAKTNYYDKAAYVADDTITLCMSFQDANGSNRYDGVVPYVHNADGMPLKASTYYGGGNDGSYTDITNDLMLQGKAVATVGTAQYKTFAEAVDALQDGDKLTMLANATYTANEGVLAILNDATLDINGKKLRVDSLVASNGDVIDNTDGDGIIMVTNSAETAVQLNKGNDQMPLYDRENEGYRLFNVEKTNLGIQVNNEDSWKYGFRFTMNNDAYALLKDAANCGMKVYYDMYDEEFDVENHTVLGEFDAALLTKYAAGIQTDSTYAFILDIYGLNRLQDRTDFKVTARIESTTGVSMTEVIAAK